MDGFNASLILPAAFSAAGDGFHAGGGHEGRSSSHCGGGASLPSMDGRIWGRLPHPLQERVIAFLPPPAFFRARAVCKRWYALLFSASFLHLYLHLSPRHPCFLFFVTSTDRGNTKAALLFDPRDLSWHRLPYAFVPDGFSPESSSGGLVCWVSSQPSPKTLLLCNPLLGTHQLPPTLRARLCPSVGLAVGASSIDVVVAGDDLISPYAVKNLTAEAFHVDAGGCYSIWATVSSLPRLCSPDPGRMVHVDGRFYCMDSNPFGVLAYDVAGNGWMKIPAPMQRFLRSPSLVESGGRVVLVGAVEKSKLSVPRSLRLWGLQHHGGAAAWAEIERMPPQMYAEFAAAEGNRGFDSVGHGQFVVIVIRGASDRAVLFDFQIRRWRWMPACPFLAHGDGNGGGGCGGGGDRLHGFAYEPKLATPVTGLLDHFTLPFPSFNA